MLRTLLLLVVSSCSLLAFTGCGGSSSSGPSPVNPAPPVTPPPSANPTPSVTSVAPNTIVAGSAAQTVTVTGTGFIQQSIASINATALATTYVSATSLTAVIPASAIAADGAATITIANPAPGGGASPAQPYIITVPTPVIGSVTPQSVVQNASATITIRGTGFEANSIGLWNGSKRTTTYVNSTTLKVLLTAADVKNFGSGEITVTNPGGLITTPLDLAIIASLPTISYVSPNSIAAYTGSNISQQIQIIGNGFAANATVQANGNSIPVVSENSTNISATLHASYFAAAGTINIVVSNPGEPVVQSNAGVISVTGAAAPSFTLSPSAVPAGSPDTVITIYGTGFYPDSIVEWNSTPLVTTYSDSSDMTAVIPAALLSGFANVSINIATAENAGHAPPSQPFTTYLSLTVNDIVYNATDGLIYASTPGVAGPGLGNSIVGIDPSSGVILKDIFVGSEPNRLAISTDGTQLFVGLDGASAMRQVNLTINTAGVQVGLGGGEGLYSPTFTATGLAAVPGEPNSVAVLATSGLVTIYDSGVARANTGPSSNYDSYGDSAALSFGNSASTLYVIGSDLYKLSVDSTGVASSTTLSTPMVQYSTVQFDSGRLYTSAGIVLSAATGTQLGQFSAETTYSPSLAPVSGPTVSDSVLGKAFIVPTGLFNTSAVLAFNEATFNPVGTLALGGIGSSGSGTPADLIRWGQDGLAFHIGNQLYVVHSSLVKDTTGSPADLQVTIQAPATAATGNSLTYQFNVANLGADASSGTVLNLTLPVSVIPGNITGTQGSCSGTTVVYCDLGSIASGSTATVSVIVTPTTSGAIEATASVSSVSYDPVAGNNQATASTTVTGSLYSGPTTVTQLSPSNLQAGSSAFTLDVDGTGFSTASTVLWNESALPTTFVSDGQLTATVSASLVANYGYALISVSTSAPGGGQSAALPLSIYKILSIPANAIVYDPFSRQLYAALPSTSTPLAGNSIVAIDPTTGIAATPVVVGSEPNLLSETSDGNYLYVGLSGAASLGRFSLLNQTLDSTVPIFNNQFGSNSQVAAQSIAAVPGTDTSVAIELDAFDGIGILDISGNTGTFRANFTQPYTGDYPVFGDATHFYAYDASTTGAEFYRYTIGSGGVTLIDGSTLKGFGGFGGHIAYDDGIVYGSGGAIVNPLTTQPTELGLLPFGNGTDGSSLVGGSVIPDTQQARAFANVENDAGTSLNYLQRFDTAHFLLEEQIPVPTAGILGVPSGTRWGQDGLAILLPGSASDGTSQIFLIRGPFVLPSETVSNPAPALSNTSENTIPAGTGNLYLSMTGSGFLPGAVALWNGVPRSTTYTDSAHLSVAISAADVRTAATITLTSQNPGSNMSNSLTIQVQ